MNSHCKKFVLILLLLVTIVSAFTISYAALNPSLNRLPSETYFDDGGGGGGGTHTHSYKQTKAPTCTAKGTETCSCGATRDIPALGHNYEWKSVSASQHEQICSRCGKKLLNSIGNHKWSGESCSICGTTHNHNYVQRYNETMHYEQCTVCENTRFPQVHQYVGNKCSVCGYVKSSSSSTTPTESCQHSSYRIVKDSTCTETGIKECEDCGKQLIIAKKPHSFSSDWKSVSELNHAKICSVCGATGSESRHTIINGRCQVCGYSPSSSTTPQEPTTPQNPNETCNHIWGWRVVPGSPDFHEQYCPKCKATQNRGIHKISKNLSVAAKCTTTGKEVCETCGAVKVTEALGHNYVNGVCTRCKAKDPNNSQTHVHDFTYEVTKKPTCTDEGKGKCSCGKTGKIPALGGEHEWFYYFVDNNTHRKSCQKCQAVVLNEKHTFIVDTEPTCVSKGKQICSCNLVKDIPALGHDYSVFVPIDEDYHKVACSRSGCGVVKGKEAHSGAICKKCKYRKGNMIPLTFEDEELSVICTHPATTTEYVCDRKGLYHTKRKVCTTCGEVISSSTENHTSSNTKVVGYEQSTLTTHTTTMECKRCGIYTLEESHEYDDENVCKKCNYDQDAPVITSISFKSKSYTKKIGDIVDFSELVKVEPSNARYLLIFGNSDTEAIEMQGNGKAEMKKESKGVTITVVDKITNLTASTTVKINKGGSSSVNDGSSDLSGKDKITRAQFIYALARLDKAETAGYANYFDDVLTSDMYSESIAWATSNGLVNGVGNGNFAPENYITRQEVAVILYNYLLKFHPYLLTEGVVSKTETTPVNVKTFNDDAQIASWAKEAVYALCSMGIIQGRSDGNFDPTANLSKGEAGLLISRIGRLITVGGTSNTQDDSNNKSETTPSVDDTSDHLTGPSTLPEQNTETTPNVDDTSDHLIGPSTLPEQNTETTPSTSTVDTARYYTPSDFGQWKPIMDKNSYTEEDFLRMEEELRTRVDEAGFGTRAGTVAAALYLASLDYAVPYRGTPMDRENYQGTYNKLGMNRQWGRYIALKRDISETYKKGWVGLNGLDCGAFVTWALVNGGVLAEGQAVSVSPQQYAHDSQPKKISEVFDQIEPGDIMYTYGERNGTKTWTHVALVVGRDSQNVYIAESTTGKLNKVVVTAIPKDTTGGKSWVTLADDKLYKAKNADGTENKGNVPIVWH